MEKHEIYKSDLEEYNTLEGSVKIESNTKNLGIHVFYYSEEGLVKSKHLSNMELIRICKSGYIQSPVFQK